jgi:hypothetical protein
MRIIPGMLLLLAVPVLNAQTDLTISGKTFTNSDDTWLGVDIPRSVPTKLIFKNNSITSSNSFGYMLQAGDEAPAPTNNNLDGAVITGNKLTWTGTDDASITHGLFTGHNRNVVVKYNYLNNVPMGIISKSGNNMSHTGGGIAYNIVKGGATAMVVKGISNLNIYNNTFYGDRTRLETWRALLHVYTNTDFSGYSVAHGTKIFNNIFYTKHDTYAITIDDEESLKDLKCDYNVYWSEAGVPLFNVNGKSLTFTEWQAMGFDAHSVVLNPEFRDLINFVPAKRLDYGTVLGQEWSQGLSSKAVWGVTDPAFSVQNGKWQAGAIVISDSSASAVEINIYPVPAGKYIDISNLQAGTSTPVMKIFDISGRILIEKNLTGDMVQRVPINLSPGVYVLRLESGSGKHTRKIVVY